jgi:hypothetical protein
MPEDTGFGLTGGFYLMVADRCDRVDLLAV